MIFVPLPLAALAENPPPLDTLVAIKMVRGHTRRPCKLRPASACYIVLAHRKSKSTLPAHKPRGESKGGFTPRRLQAALQRPCMSESPRPKNRPRSHVSRMGRGSHPCVARTCAAADSQAISLKVDSCVRTKKEGTIAAMKGQARKQLVRRPYSCAHA